MNDLEFYTNLYQFLVDNMGAFAHWPTDVGMLNDLMLEISKRKEKSQSRRAGDEK